MGLPPVDEPKVSSMMHAAAAFDATTTGVGLDDRWGLPYILAWKARRVLWFSYICSTYSQGGLYALY